MRPNVVRDKNVVLDDDVSRQRDLVREYVVVADNAVVSNVNADHQKIAGSDAGDLVFPVRPVQRAKLPNDVVVADFEVTALAAKLHVLRFAADNGVLENAISGAQPGITLNDGVGADIAVWADFDVILDNCCGMYRHLQGFEDNRVLWILQILFMMPWLLQGLTK